MSTYIYRYDMMRNRMTLSIRLDCMAIAILCGKDKSWVWDRYKSNYKSVSDMFIDARVMGLPIPKQLRGLYGKN